MCLQSLFCFFSAESVVAGYALRHRAQQYSSQHKKCLGHRLAAARLATAQAFLHLPPYSCLSSPFSNCSSKGSCRSFPMFLQHIAGIHFTDVPVRFVPAVYTLPQPRTAVCRHTRFGLLILALACRHTAVFPIARHHYIASFIVS